MQTAEWMTEPRTLWHMMHFLPHTLWAKQGRKDPIPPYSLTPLPSGGSNKCVPHIPAPSTS